MPRIQAKHIDELPAGSRLTINGRAYMRLADHEDRHIGGWVADIETGWMGAWYRLILQDEMVTVEHALSHQRSELQEALDELDGVKNSIRAHMNGAGGHWATIVHVEQAQTRLRRVLSTFGTPEVTNTENTKKDGPNV